MPSVVALSRKNSRAHVHRGLGARVDLEIVDPGDTPRIEPRIGGERHRKE